MSSRERVPEARGGEADGSAQEALAELPAGLRSRWKVGPVVVGVVLGLLALLIGSLFMPDCRRIPAADVASFETVRSLEQRAASGEPFEKKNGTWYQCKPRIARMFFF